MKIKLDENIPSSLTTFLKKLGNDADTVCSEGIGGKPDEKVWEYALKENRFLKTQDLGFSDIRKYKPGTHYGILILRLANPSRLNLIDRIINIFQHENIETWKGCLIIATDRKERIKKPE